MSALPVGTASVMEVVPRRVSSPVFVGRGEALAALEAAPAFALVAGEPGVGKSRLVSEFAARAELPVLVGQCREHGSPYAPLVGALGEPVRDPLLAQFVDRGPLALVIEDLHWADSATRDFLGLLVRAESVFVVATYRSDELHRRHPLRPVLAELERAPGVERIALDRFSPAEATEQVAGILGDEPDPDLADRLYARTRGNALHAEELLASGGWGATLRDAVVERFERLPAVAQDVVRVAAVAERPVGHELLEAVLAGEVMEGVAEAIDRHVLVPHPDGTHGLRHALVGEAIYEDLLPGERTALHAALGHALAAEPGTAAAELACHWRGAHDLPRALGASVAAGVEARRLQAHGEVLRHFESALALWDRVPGAAERAGMPRADVLRAAAAAADGCFQSSRAAALRRGLAGGLE